MGVEGVVVVEGGGRRDKGGHRTPDARADLGAIYRRGADFGAICGAAVARGACRRCRRSNLRFWSHLSTFGLKILES